MIDLFDLPKLTSINAEQGAFHYTLEGLSISSLMIDD